jgi:RNA polymerase sigma-70 factor (ECF subfamily)
VVRLNWASAFSAPWTCPKALAQVDALADALKQYYLFHATRAELLRALGRRGEAQAADRAALRLAQNPAERALLRRRLRQGEVFSER